MIDNVLNSICISINKEFGNAYRIYTEKVKQGLKEPCFFISIINPTHQHELGVRYLKRSLFSIQYIPKNEKAECIEVGERLFKCLEILKTNDGLYSGDGMNYKIVDNVLNFFVSYKTFARKSTKIESMQDINVVIKENTYGN